MANSHLQGNFYKFPPQLQSLLQNVLQSFQGNKKDAGFVRFSNYLSNGGMTYDDLKNVVKLANQGELSVLTLDKQNAIYNWVVRTLESERSAIELRKKQKSDSGQQNAYRKTHLKNEILKYLKNQIL